MTNYRVYGPRTDRSYSNAMMPLGEVVAGTWEGVATKAVDEGIITKSGDYFLLNAASVANGGMIVHVELTEIPPERPRYSVKVTVG